MRPISLPVLSFIILLALYCSCSDGHHIVPAGTSSLSDEREIEDLPREKRQVENFDDEYPTGSSQDSQEEPSFWDRVVKVALKLFSRFVEWLNA